MRQDLPIFTYIKQDKRNAQIDEFLNKCLGKYAIDSLTNDSSNAETGITTRTFIKQMTEALPFDFTIVTEPYHVDKTFRDTYYMYFASQHFQVDRYCTRITLLKGSYNWEKLLFDNEEDLKSIEDDVISTCVIVPVSSGIIGRSLLNPAYFFSGEGSYIRISRFRFHMYGIPLSINAFPYQMQDKETMRCSEVTLLNLMDYYSNTYKDYKTVIPSEIIESEQRHSHERALPSRGITYHMLTKVMSDLGFSPRLYNLRAMRNDAMSGISQNDELKRLMHYYVESGIPVAVNVEPSSGRGIGHSMLCIGHSEMKNTNNETEIMQVLGNPLEKGFNKSESFGIIDSADFYNRYVVIDDNQFPYTISDFDHLSIYKDMQVTNIAVPLYKRMFMEAADAREITYEILKSDKWGVFCWAKDYMHENGIKDIIVRLFLASSRSFKSERVRSLSTKSKKLQMIYELIRLPQFIWVCEVYSSAEYFKEDSSAFAEIVLDGTSANKKGIRNIIMLSYPYRIYSRNPEEFEEDEEATLKRFEVGEPCLIPSYKKNLKYFKKL